MIDDAILEDPIERELKSELGKVDKICGKAVDVMKFYQFWNPQVNPNDVNPSIQLAYYTYVARLTNNVAWWSWMCSERATSSSLVLSLLHFIIVVKIS